MKTRVAYVLAGVALGLLLAAVSMVAYAAGQRSGRGKTCYEVALSTPDAHGVSLRTGVMSNAELLTDYTFWGTQCTLSIGWTAGGKRLGGRWRYDVPSATLFADDETAEKVFPAAGRWRPRHAETR
jgi:hypothetical protein